MNAAVQLQVTCIEYDGVTIGELAALAAVDDRNGLLVIHLCRCQPGCQATLTLSNAHQLART